MSLVKEAVLILHSTNAPDQSELSYPKSVLIIIHAIHMNIHIYPPL